MKRFLSLLLALTLLAALPLTASAAEFTDLEGHWAAAYIAQLAELGYLSGYPDGTVRPDSDITACEAISLLARFYTVDDSTAALIHQDYGDFVSTNIDPTLSWAYKQIEICLATGILSEKEIRSLRLTVPVDKEMLSVLLVRALQLTDQAAALKDDGVKLSFEDAGEISATWIGHVAVLVNNKIISGNSHNEFDPHSKVNRAVVAVMVSKGLDYVKSLGRQLTVPGYDKASVLGGVLTGVSGTAVSFRDTNGFSRSYTRSDKSVITVGGKTDFQDLMTGAYVDVRAENGAILSMNQHNDVGYTWLQGVVSELAKTAGGYNLGLRDQDTGKVTRFQLPAKTAVQLDGKSKTVGDLKTGMFLTVTQFHNNPEKIAAVSGPVTLKGTVARLTYGTPAVLEVRAEDGATVSFSLDLTKLPAISRGDNPVGIERILVGDEVTLTAEACQLTKIAATASGSTIDGVLDSIITTSDGTTWRVTDAQDETHSLVLSSSATAYQGGKAILMSLIQVNDSISVAVNGNTITEVYLRSTGGNSANKATGTLLAIDSKTKTILIQTANNRIVTVSTADVASTIDSLTGKTVRLSSDEIGRTLVAYGTYQDASNFIAKSIVLEG